MSESPNTSATLRKLFTTTMRHGDLIAPRGHEIREIRDAIISVNPFAPFQEWEARKYSISYFKKEMRWKLGASKYDESIKAHAKMWESVQNPDKTFNSNYGQYWFGQQMGLMKAVLELIRDEDSRRAVIPMLTDNHLSPETSDTVCTESITLFIRNDHLYMSVHMRSSDQVFGLGTDIPTFSVLLHLAYGLLVGYYPTLCVGSINITAASSHIYQRHFEMVNEIIMGFDPADITLLPSSSGAEESMAIIAARGKLDHNIDVRSNWDLFNFIYSE